MSAPYFFSNGVNGWFVRADMVEALEEYVSLGRPLGDFLQAVIANDLRDAVGRADNLNVGQLPAFVAYVYNEMPSTSHGSRQRYTAWLEQHAKIRAAQSIKTTTEEAANAHEKSPRPRP